MYIDPSTALAVANPHLSPLDPHDFPEDPSLQKALATLILSASGWRKVFAASGEEEDVSAQLSPADRVITAGMAWVFGQFLQKTTGRVDPLVVLGLDSRPTGPTMGDIMGRIFLALGLRVEYLFIVAAPEIMAYAKVTPGVDGFAYVSASHNPVGHNGVKFGLNTGGVLSGPQVNPLIENFRKLFGQNSWRPILGDLCEKPLGDQWAQVLTALPGLKKASEAAYGRFTIQVVTGLPDPQKAQELWEGWCGKFAARPLGVVSEFNGSARCLSIDSQFLLGAGLKNIRLNHRPRQFVHRIVPEGASLDLCKTELEKAWRGDKSFLLGYVPDCDGDRGNLVYLDEPTGSGRILEAQEVFALAVLGELACSQYLKARGLLPAQKTAVVVNDATSRRIEAIAEVLGAQVFRCEVGEANVVEKAAALRAEGWEVRVLGEGSNGGNILHPAAVRDPLNTLFSLVKLLTLGSDDQGPGLFEIWCRASGQAYKPEFSLSEILATLPAYLTTSAYEPEALLKITTQDHGVLKARYEELFLRDWEEKKDELLSRWGVSSYREVNYEGLEEKIGWGPSFRSGSQRGGLKLEFSSPQGEVVAYNWMRGSGTEPVFRILTDVPGTDKEKEGWFREWHRNLVLRADKSP